jgi:hypothetical protein
MSKGSTPRPYSVTQQQHADNYDAIFRKDPKVLEDAQIENEAFELINKQKAINERTLDGKVQTQDTK